VRIGYVGKCWKSRRGARASPPHPAFGHLLPHAPGGGGGEGEVTSCRAAAPWYGPARGPVCQPVVLVFQRVGSCSSRSGPTATVLCRVSG
jgi:hypothetical protein